MRVVLDDGTSLEVAARYVFQVVRGEVAVLPPGAYSVRLAQGRRQVTAKVVVIR